MQSVEEYITSEAWRFPEQVELRIVPIANSFRKSTLEQGASALTSKLGISVTIDEPLSTDGREMRMLGYEETSKTISFSACKALCQLRKPQGGKFICVGITPIKARDVVGCGTDAAMLVGVLSGSQTELTMIHQCLHLLGFKHCDVPECVMYKRPGTVFCPSCGAKRDHLKTQWAPK